MNEKQRFLSKCPVRFAIILFFSTLSMFHSLRHSGILFAADSDAQAVRETMFSPEQLAFFEKRVRPLLIKNCQKCHGADKQQGGLRLDSRQAILQGGDSGPAANLEDLKSSLLLEAVSYAPDAVVEMPPDGRLKKEEVNILVRWVGAGLPWPSSKDMGEKPGDSDKHSEGETFSAEQREYWSFQPVKLPNIPEVRNDSWLFNEVDRFVLAKLEQQGLSPAPAADKRTLIRRATFDLTGLPPTPGEVDAFLKDDSPGAYSKIIDRLLASAAYGERWGRHWLDVARYADSNGMDENLAQANAFRYRDYVINAFNNDKPYDQFVQEQIAGDLMPDSRDERVTLERLVATGFLGIGPKMLAEDDPVKMEMDIIDEQIDTIGKCFMGITLGCARCHDHKFDPVLMSDYYALAGIFKSTKTMNNFRVVAQWFERPVETNSVVTRYREFESRAASQQKAIDELLAAANRDFLVTARRHVTDYLLTATEHRETVEKLTAFTAKLNSTSPPIAQGDIQIEAENFTRGNVDRIIQTKMPRVEVIETYKRGASSAEYDISAEHDGKYALFLRYTAAERRPLRLSLNGAVLKPEAADQVTGRWDAEGHRWFFETTLDLPEGGNTIRLECTDLFPHVDCLRLVPAENMTAAPKKLRSLLETAREARLNPGLLKQFMAYLQKTRDDQTSILAPWHQLNEELSRSLTSSQNRQASIDAGSQDKVHSARLEFLRRFRENFDKAEAAWKKVQSAADGKEQKSLPDSQLEAFRLFLYDPAGPFRLPKNIEEYYPLDVREKLASDRESLRVVKQSAPPPLKSAMGVTEGKVQNARICIRGNHVNLGKEVPRRFLTIFAGEKQKPLDGKSSGRLELAEWLTNPDHPLTSRAIVNRVWRWHFGAGLVRTPDNLGLTGERPTNQALLDWLAIRFVQSGWSLKKLHRSIMLSSTYRMSTDYNAEAAHIDPENRLLWRANRKRLEAEAIRDSILFVAGTLDFDTGGAPLLIKNRAYVTSTASNVTVEFNNTHRSVYQPIVRSALYEMFQAFDFPDPSALQGSRSTTTVASQALFMLNSQFLDRQTEAMAKRLIADHPQAEPERVSHLYSLAFGRDASVEELAEAGQFLERYRTLIGNDTEDKSDRELVAWKALCRVLLSSSEFLYVE